jgi:hypothetical protein
VLLYRLASLIAFGRVGLRRRSIFSFGELRPWVVLADYSFDRMKQNLTITNSDGIGDLFRSVYGIESVTLYPPADGDFRPLPWSQRENGFVAIGRINVCKRFEWIIETITPERFTRKFRTIVASQLARR